MANYATLKAAVADVVKTNGAQEITGENLQTVLLSIINSIGSDYQLAGIASPSTNAGTPDQNLFYIAPAGTYSNFGDAYTVQPNSIGVFYWNGSWAKIQINLGGGESSRMDFIPCNYSNNMQGGTSLKCICYEEGIQAIIRHKRITGIVVDIWQSGTMSILKVPKASIDARLPIGQIGYEVVQTFNVSLGWNRLELTNPLVLGEGYSLGFFASSDTASFAYQLVDGEGYCNFVAPYGGWHFGNNTLYPSNYNLNIGVLTKEGESSYHPVEEACVGLFSYDGATLAASSMSARGGYYFSDYTQQRLRGKTITHIRVNVASKGYLSVVVATNFDDYSTAWFDTRETIEVRETGWQVYALQNPITLQEGEWLGFNTDDQFTFYATSDKIGDAYGTSKGFVFWSSTTYRAEGYALQIQAICGGTPSVNAAAHSRVTKLAGKNVTIMGDSISSFQGVVPAGYEYFYPQGEVSRWQYMWFGRLATAEGFPLAAKENGVIQYRIRGWSGSKVTNLQGGDKPFCSDARLGSLGDPDVILFFGGINDLAGGSPLPQMGDEPQYGGSTWDLSKFKDAYAYCVQYIITNYPQARLVCMTPTQISSLGHWTANAQGVKFNDITEAIKEISSQYGVYVIDMSRCGLTYENTDDYTLDGVHPNIAGMKLIANYVRSQLNSIL